MNILGLSEKCLGLVPKYSLMDVISANAASKGVCQDSSLFEHFFLHEMTIFAFFCSIICVFQLMYVTINGFTTAIKYCEGLTRHFNHIVFF